MRTSAARIARRLVQICGLVYCPIGSANDPSYLQAVKSPAISRARHPRKDGPTDFADHDTHSRLDLKGNQVGRDLHDGKGDGVHH
jgi:hypothetical protein